MLIVDNNHFIFQITIAISSIPTGELLREITPIERLGARRHKFTSVWMINHAVTLSEHRFVHKAMSSARYMVLHKRKHVHIVLLPPGHQLVQSEQQSACFNDADNQTTQTGVHSHSIALFPLEPYVLLLWKSHYYCHTQADHYHYLHPNPCLTHWGMKCRFCSQTDQGAVMER